MAAHNAATNRSALAMFGINRLFVVTGRDPVTQATARSTN